MGLVLVLLAFSALACQAVTGLGPTSNGPTPAVTGLTGTRWFIYYTEPSGDYYEYELRFQLNGRLENTHPNDSTPDNDAWQQSGDVVTLLFNDAYATYTGSIVGDTITGTAVNVTGAFWSWDAYLLP
jgi:hypothetical protein